MSQFSINTNIFWGPNRYPDLKNFLSINDYKTTIFIVDQAVYKLPIIAEIQRIINNWGYEIEQIVPFRIIDEPTYDTLDESLQLFSQITPDFIIAIGGGSLIDLAKGISILLTNPGKGIDYRGMNKVNNPSVPLIAFPTTAGTGTEVTWTASFIDDNEEKKLGINGKNVLPLCGVLEPKLVSSCPNKVAVGAGLDAMVHAVEAITAKNATQITKALGVNAFSLIFNYLPIALNRRDNYDAWEQVQLGASLAGIAMMNAGGGPASGVSYPIGVFYGVPHGIAGGVFLRGVFEQNIKKGYTGYSILFDMLNNSNYEKLNEKEKSIEFLTLFNNFYEKIGAPKTLKEWGINNMSDVEKLVDITISQRIENLELNPVPYGKNELTLLLKGIL